MGLFTNGNARITRLILIQVGLGVLVMTLVQILGNLPSLDFLTPRALKLTSFILGTLITTIRGAEMFFSKTASLLKTGELPVETTDTAFLTKPQTVVTTQTTVKQNNETTPQ